MSYPIESFPESKKEFELIENVSSNRGNKLKRGVEYIHRKDMAWTNEGFKPIGSEQSNKAEVKSEFKANALKSVKGNKEGKTSTSSLLTVNATQPHSSQPKPQDQATPSIYEQNSYTIQQQARNLEMYKKQSISFLTSQKAPTENYCKNILSFIQQEFEFRKGLEKLGDFINNKEFDDGSNEGESSEFKRAKRKAMELTEEVNYNTSEFERFLKASRSKLLKTISTINDYSSIVISSGDPEQIKLMEINNGGKKFSDVAGGKYSKNVKNGTNKSKVKPSTSGAGGVSSSGTKPSHGNSKGAGSSNKPKTK